MYEEIDMDAWMAHFLFIYALKCQEMLLFLTFFPLPEPHDVASVTKHVSQASESRFKSLAS